MSKVLITSIGTGQKREGGYQTANYEIDGKVYENESFIAKVLVQHKNIDKVFIVGTNQSIWDNAYGVFGGDEEIELELYEKKETKQLKLEDLDVLNKQIDNYLNTEGSKCYLIEYGINENELWQNFDILIKIASQIENGDEVYLDITHSFRSLSLMSFIMTEFIKTISNKNFTIAGVFYGMFEYRFENNGISPIVDLKMFFDLLEWIKSINDMNNFASLNRLTKMLSQSNLNEEEFQMIQNISDAFEISNMNAVYENIKKLNKHIDKLKNSDNKILSLISPDIESFVKRLNKQKLSDFQLELALFFAEKHNYAMAYTSLGEAVITKGCEDNSLSLKDKKDRDKVKNSLVTFRKYGDDYKLLNNTFKKVMDIRNTLCHQLSNGKSPKYNMEKFYDFYEDIKTLLKKLNLKI